MEREQDGEENCCSAVVNGEREEVTARRPAGVFAAPGRPARMLRGELIAAATRPLFHQRPCLSESAVKVPVDCAVRHSAEQARQKLPVPMQLVHGYAVLSRCAQLYLGCRWRSRCATRHV